MTPPPHSWGIRARGPGPIDVTIMGRRIRQAGTRTHKTASALERDRERDAALTRGGYMPLRTTWRELDAESHSHRPRS